MEGKDTFSTAADFTFHPSIEGGYTVDQGGPTNYGITQKTADSFNKQYGYAPMDVKQMTPDDAKFIAQKQFFEAPGFNGLPDKTAIAAFDYGINSGPYQAIKDLQRTVGVKADGKLGPQSYAAINSYIQQNGEDALVNDYIGRRQQLMENLATNNPAKYSGSINGWHNRIDKLKYYLNVSGQQAQTQEQ